MFTENTKLILDVLDNYYSDYVVYKIIQIYYYRSRKGLSIKTFLELLLVTINKDQSLDTFANADDFLKYLQGCINNYLVDLI